MIKCEHCKQEFQVYDADILTVSSELMQAEVVCPLCKKEFSVKMEPVK
jgi:hypothetical protein